MEQQAEIPRAMPEPRMGAASCPRCLTADAAPLIMVLEEHQERLKCFGPLLTRWKTQMKPLALTQPSSAMAATQETIGG